MATSPSDQSEFLYPDEVFRIRGAVFEVNREMGSGFLEAVYQECLALEFAARDIPFVASPSLRLAYKGRLLARRIFPISCAFLRS